MIAVKSRKLTGALMGVCTLLPLFGVGVATASILPGGIGADWQQWVLDRLDPLEQILGELKRDSPILETIMDESLGDIWENLKTATGSDSPNPYEIRVTPESRGAGVLSTSPVVRQRDLANLYDQETARAMAAPVLGEDGDQWLQAKAGQLADLVESSQQGAGQVQQLADKAQGQSVTQDVMKTQAEMNGAIASLITQQTQLSADNHTALLQLQRLQGVIAQLAANTSEGIDEANRRERVEREVQIMGSTQAPIYIPGLFGTNDASSDTSDPN